MIVTATIIFGAIGLMFATAAFWVQWWWFGSAGYRFMLVDRYIAQASVLISATLITGLAYFGNVRIALRRSRLARPRAGRVAAITDRVLVFLGIATGVIISAGFGLAAAARWETWLLWWNSEPFGYDDPIFGRDIGFFVFALPALNQAVDLVLLLTLLCVAAVVVVYALRLGFSVRQIRSVPALMRVHLLALAGFVFLLLAIKQYLSTYQLAYSTRGAVFGAGYTDVQVQRPVNWLLAATALAIGGILVANAFVQRVRLLMAAIITWGVLYVILGLLVPTAVQQTVVEPSELKREAEFIENHIAMTRVSYGLATVEERELSGDEPVTAQALAANPTTLGNVRLWDYRIIQGTYQQLQSFVPYYVFIDVDVDRYIVEGEIQQVLISARELDQSGLPLTAQTWTNERLVYTHGYGLVVSQAADVSPQGLPTFLVERIPPTGTGAYFVERPEIYFGEADLGWVIVDTDQAEFSGLVDEPEISAEPGYSGSGTGSINLGNYLKKLLLAVELRDRNLMLSGNIRADSDVILHRNIEDRVKLIAPFLELDPDPYLVIADGRLVWIIDAYTTSNLFPHAARAGEINYIRNSVKITVDAYDGTVNFYRTNEPDPIADAYGRLYNGLFTPVDEAPPSITAHFRYPERLFEVQSDIYASIHVTNATSFYNGEDFWQIPQEQVSGTPQRMAPYFVTMTLPGEASPAFSLIRPFIPGGRSQRQNMAAWMAGQTEPDGSTSLVVYRFPRQETVFGPTQIEARINQEPEISAQISLWSQAGSRVLRGNLLVIPIGESVLYVQPLYLQAADAVGALPELKRVIVASSERVVMSETLDGALAALTGADPGSRPDRGAESPDRSGVPALENPLVQAQISRAVEAFTRGEQALADGDWAAYGAAQDDLEAALLELNQLTGAGMPPTSGSPQASPVAIGQ